MLDLIIWWNSKALFYNDTNTRTFNCGIREDNPLAFWVDLIEENQVNFNRPGMFGCLQSQIAAIAEIPSSSQVHNIQEIKSTTIRLKIKHIKWRINNEFERIVVVG